MRGVDAIFQRYCALRNRGLSSGEVQETLQSYFSRLDQMEKRDLARRMSSWEAERTQQDLSLQVREALLHAAEIERVKDNIICSNCEALNNPGMTHCSICNQSLQADQHLKNRKSTFTVPIAHTSGDVPFTVDSVVILDGNRSEEHYEVRPQSHSNGVTLGRFTSDARYRPDVDITMKDSIDYGVSRIHAALRYDGVNHSIQIVDMGSTNGTYINGERVRPNQITALRHGDVLQMGKLHLNVRFELRVVQR